jgi:hypothetical protein
VSPSARELVSIQCSTCGAQIRLGEESCASCGRKISRDESDALRRRWEAADPEAARRSDVVAHGRAALLVVAALAFMDAIVYGVIGESVPTLAFDLVITASMIALFFVGARRPLGAMVAGLTVYLVLQVAVAMVSWSALAQGVFFKVLVVVALTTGIGAEAYRRKLENDVVRRRAH